MSEWPALLPNARMMSKPDCLGLTSGSMALLQSSSVLMAEVLVIIEGYADTQGLGLSWCLRDALPWGLCQSEWPLLSPGAMATTRPSCC